MGVRSGGSAVAQVSLRPPYTRWVPKPRPDRPAATVLLAQRRFAAPPRAVYDLFVARLWRDGAGVPPRPVIEEEGDRDGLGCTRRIGNARGMVRERITATAAPGRLAYRVLPGSPAFPADDHLGVVEFFADRAGGTLLRWRITFVPRRRGLAAMARAVIAWYLFVLGRAVRQSKNS